jgi:signal peptide peptidase SppA
MKYAHIARYVGDTLWAIEPDKLRTLLSVLAFRASGQEFTAEEIQARIGEGRGASEASTRGAVAVIPVRGMIAHRMGSMDDSSGGTSCERIAAMIDQVAADPAVGTIVYDYDTPGGTVTGVPELADKMFALRDVKKQIAVINGMCASAGYYLASQCDEIVCIPSGQAGSIGVYSAHNDLSAALEKAGIKVTLISAGTYKTEGNPFEPLSEEALAVKQASVDAAYGQFVKAVARGRGVTPAAVKSGFGEGRVLKATDAKAAGLIDRIGTMEQTLSKALGSNSGAGMRAEASDAELAAIHAGAASVVDQAVEDLRARRRRLL